MIVHPIQPVYDKDSRVLILGSFPSVKSREEGFFYGHPQNRFWKVTAAIFNEETPKTTEEKKAFLEELGIRTAGLDQIIQAAYHLLGLRTFFTVGEPENRAWTFREGMKAPQCAGIIHTDFEKGFIKAEVYSYEDIMEYKTEAALREHGKLRIEGKDYVMKDGDIVYFRFNV